MSDALDVTFSGNKVHYMFTPQGENDYEKFIDAEYGSPQSSPTPLLRPFAASNADPFSKRIEDRLRDEFL